MAASEDLNVSRFFFSRKHLKTLHNHNIYIYLQIMTILFLWFYIFPYFGWSIANNFVLFSWVTRAPTVKRRFQCFCFFFKKKNLSCQNKFIFHEYTLWPYFSVDFIFPIYNPFSANFTKWSNTLKQFVDKLRITSSNPWVRRLKEWVARLKARVEAIKPQLRQ